MTATDTLGDGRELTLKRRVDAPPSAVWRAWTEPEILKLWFAPRPWSTTHAEFDLRPGGSSLIVMRSPDGEEFPNRGTYLEVDPERRLVFTDAYVTAWEPAEKPFMTVIVTLEPDGAGTLYSVRVLHWTFADREQHEQMGFHEGWGQCADQLAEIAKTL